MRWRKKDDYCVVSVDPPGYQISKAFGTGGKVLAYTAWAPADAMEKDRCLGYYYPEKLGGNEPARKAAIMACKMHLKEKQKR